MEINERVLSSGRLSVSVGCMCGRQWMVVVDDSENSKFAGPDFLACGSELRGLLLHQVVGVCLMLSRALLSELHTPYSLRHIQKYIKWSTNGRLRYT